MIIVCVINTVILRHNVACDNYSSILSISRRDDGSLPDSEIERSEPETEGGNDPSTEPVATSETEPTTEPETIAENEPIPESEQQTVEETATFTTLMGLTILLILTGNVSVIIVVLKRKKLHTVTNLFILSMALADTCVALFVIPGTITSQFSEEYLGNILCKLCHYVSYSSTAVSGFALGAIALDRFRSLVFPLSPKLTNKQCTFMILLTWALGFLFGFRVVFVYGMELETMASPSFMMCKPLNEMDRVNRYLMILDFFVIFLVPTAVIGITHSVIASKLGKKKKVMNTADENNAKKRSKVVRMLMYLFSLYLVLHLPLHVYRLLLVSGAIGRNSAAAEMILMIIAFTNSWLNVICYAWMQGGMRHAFLEMSKLNKFYNKVNINKISPKSFTMGRLTTLNNESDTKNT